jgi:hypothetical protein
VVGADGSETFTGLRFDADLHYRRERPSARHHLGLRSADNICQNETCPALPNRKGLLYPTSKREAEDCIRLI